MRIANWSVLSVVVAGLCSVPFSAVAEVGMFGSSTSLIAPEDSAPLQDSHEFLLPVIAPGDLPIFREVSSSVAPSVTTLANGYAAAGLGQIKTRSLATYPLDGTLGSAAAESLVVVQETATATSSTGSPGDSISVALNLHVAGTVSSPASYDDDLYDASATAVLIAGDLSKVSLSDLFLAFSQDGTVPSSPDYTLLSFNSHTSTNPDVTGSFSTTVGASFDLFYAMLTNANVTGTSPARTASVDYSNTLTFSLIPAEPGSSITTFGGQQFTAPVPEPQTWLLLAAGLLALTSWAARRRNA